MTKPSFKTRPGLVPFPDGKNWRLDGPLEVELPHGIVIIAPKHFITDLASVPPLGWLGGIIMFISHILCQLSPWFQITFSIGMMICLASVYLKAYGKYTYAAIVHDWIFQTHEFGFTACNWILLELMRAEKTAKWERALIWFNVQAFGYFIYKNDKRVHKNTRLKTRRDHPGQQKPVSEVVNPPNSEK